MWKLKTDSYNIDLDISNDITCSFNRIWENDIFDLDSYIKKLSVTDDHSVIILWSADTRFNLNDRRVIKLNEFYHTIKNPMAILFLFFYRLPSCRPPRDSWGEGGRGGDGDRRYVRFSIILIMFIIIIISEQRGRNVGEDEE
jgi:hypothetical protein